MWRRNPNFHDHVLDFDSVRTPGARLLLDPDRKSTGFYRSIVLRPGSTTLRRSRGRSPASAARAVGAADAPAPAWVIPGRARAGRPGGRRLDRGARPLLRGRWRGGPAARAHDRRPLGSPAGRSRSPGPGRPRRTTPRQQHRPDPAAAPSPDPAQRHRPRRTSSPTRQLHRRDPGGRPSPRPRRSIAAATPAVASATPAVASEAPSADSVGDSGGRPGNSDGARQLHPPPTRCPRRRRPCRPPRRPATEPPEIDLVAPETAGTLVVTAPATGEASSRTVTLITPDAPGLYRLVTTLHDKDGVAFDAASQDQVPALIVRVTGGLWASYGLPSASPPPWVRTSCCRPAWRTAARCPGRPPPSRIRPRREAAPQRGARAWWAAGSGSRGQVSPDRFHPTPRSPPTSSRDAAPCSVCRSGHPRSPGRTCSSWTSPCPTVDRSPASGVPPALVRVTVETAPSSAGDPGARDAPAQ